MVMLQMPFEVGEEVLFRPNGQTVEGIVVDVGWYRTLIRSFEREMYVIPNAVFSKNTVLNVTRKNREWRFYEYLCVRVQDVHKVNAIIQVRTVYMVAASNSYIFIVALSGYSCCGVSGPCLPGKQQSMHSSASTGY